MDALMAKTDPGELSVMRPLEDVVHQVSAEEEWDLLAKMLKPGHLEEIRASISR
jgi:hypothetical protein